MTYYLCSKCPDLKGYSKWAEKEPEDITDASLAAFRNLLEMRDVGNNPRVLFFHLHGFLNTNLTGDAWEVFDGVDGENGLEA